MANLQRQYRARLTDPRFKEGIRQSLYDTLVFDSGVTQRLQFFAVQAGQSGKTKADTNMELAGTLPAGHKFVAEALEIHVYPGSNAGAYVRQDPVRQNAAVAVPQFANDVHALGEAGWVEVQIGTKTYLIEAPLNRFPPSAGLIVTPAVEQNLAVAAAQTVSVDYARFGGRPYLLIPNLPIEGQTAFSVSINWPAPFALPSGFDAKIKVVLPGVYFRN
jgi:hypothetical protein